MLKSVTYPDGKTVKYDYGLGMTLTDVDNNQMEARFDNQGKLRIIERAYQSNGSYADGAWLDMTYDGMFQRRFTDSLGNVEIKQFDEYGRTVCSMDGETGDYVYATYKTEEIEGKKHNILSNVSETQPTSMNYIKNHSFEENAYNWSVYSGDNTHVRFRSGFTPKLALIVTVLHGIRWERLHCTKIIPISKREKPIRFQLGLTSHRPNGRRRAGFVAGMERQHLAQGNLQCQGERYKREMGAAGDDTDGSRKRNKAALPRPHG